MFDSFISYLISKAKTVCSYLAAFLECFLWWFNLLLSGVEIVIQILSITKRLYLTENQEFWEVVLPLALILAILLNFLRLLECFLARWSYSRDLERIVTKQKAEKKICIRDNIMFVIFILSTVAQELAFYYLGGDSRTWTGDPWWLTVEQLPFFTYLFLMGDWIASKILYKTIIKRIDSDG